MMTIPINAIAFHLDLPRVAAKRAGTTAGARCASTTALFEDGSTSPCLISTSCDGLVGAELSVSSLLMSAACRVERAYAGARGHNDTVAPFGASPRELLTNPSGSFFSKEGSVVLHDELANPAQQRVVTRGQLAASRSER
jgi:hypothetical protein